MNSSSFIFLFLELKYLIRFYEILFYTNSVNLNRYRGSSNGVLKLFEIEKKKKNKKEISLKLLKQHTKNSSISRNKFP